MQVKSESEVAQSYPTLSDPMDCSLPGSSVHGIFQARELEWGAIAFSEDGSITTGKSTGALPLPILLSYCLYFFYSTYYHQWYGMCSLINLLIFCLSYWNVGS